MHGAYVDTLAQDRSCSQVYYGLVATHIIGRAYIKTLTQNTKVIFLSQRPGALDLRPERIQQGLKHQKYYPCQEVGAK